MTDAPKPYTPEELAEIRRTTPPGYATTVVDGERKRIRVWKPDERWLATLDAVTAERDAARETGKKLNRRIGELESALNDALNKKEPIVRLPSTRALQENEALRAERDALAAEVRAWRAREFDGGGPTGCGCEKCRALWGKAEQLWLANEAKGIPAPKEGG